MRRPASLDAETAYQVSDAILGLRGVTAVVVTHSLEERLLRQYDGILAMKNGSIAETGTFEELIAKKGYFYSLYTVSPVICPGAAQQGRPFCTLLVFVLVMWRIS